jgi:hypothetical protein
MLVCVVMLLRTRVCKIGWAIRSPPVENTRICGTRVMLDVCFRVISSNLLAVFCASWEFF